MNFIFKHFGKIWIACAVLSLTLMGALVYVGIHFARKAW